jgi:hypothetical protein
VDLAYREIINLSNADVVKNVGEYLSTYALNTNGRGSHYN